MDTKKKIISLERLATIVEDLKKRGKKIVTTNGAFDLLHVSHKRALEESKNMGDLLIVAVNSDLSVKTSKSNFRPIISEEQRAEMVASLECVDYVTIFDEKTPRQFLEIVKPHIHTKGTNYNAEELIEAPLVRKNGGIVVVTSPNPVTSTSKIIEKIISTYRKSA